jgi:cytochrome c-type biogenesis protein CcmF
MSDVGQLCLLTALVCSGYGGFAHLISPLRPRHRLRQAGTACGLIALGSLTVAVVLLAWALVGRDFRIEYVAHYSSQLLPWHYALSALWVGQAGSLLLWAWILAVLAVLFRFLPTTDAALRDGAFGVLLGCLAFLTALVVFAADPFRPSLAARTEGLGLSPLLQHPSMLSHPPVVFLGYAAWAVPFALAVAALLRGQLDTAWTQLARPWALFAWTVLGVGLLLGAQWAYQELGWGGYWGWDPVENGSLLPWLTGTALIHCLMAWRHRDCLKKTAVSLAVVTFGLCNFATFLTRSGVFSSVHAFSQSPIGWMFLAFMGALLAGGIALVVFRRAQLTPRRAARSLLARESLVLFSTFLLLVLSAAVLAGTLVGPVSGLLQGRTVVIGPAFYNNVLIPTGLLLLAATAAVPLLRWGHAPAPAQRRVLRTCLAVSVAATAAGFCLGIRHFIPLTVTGLATCAACSFLGMVSLDARRREPRSLARGLLRALAEGHRQYAGYVIHLGFIALAVGVTGSSLGSRRHEAVLKDGDAFEWAGRQIRYVGLEERHPPDKLVLEAVLEITRGGGPPMTLRPARHLHRLQNEWTTEVAIHSTWGSDFYTVLDAGLGDGTVVLTFVENPMMRWIWLGGAASAAGALVALLPRGRRSQAASLATGGPTADGPGAVDPVTRRQAA